MDRNIILHFLDLSNVVALRKESVDRNKNTKPTEQTQGLSLSARRAWIEIHRLITSLKAFLSRSPQGERG